MEQPTVRSNRWLELGILLSCILAFAGQILWFLPDWRFGWFQSIIQPILPFANTSPKAMLALSGLVPVVALGAVLLGVCAVLVGKEPIRHIVGVAGILVGFVGFIGGCVLVLAGVVNVIVQQ